MHTHKKSENEYKGTMIPRYAIALSHTCVSKMPARALNTKCNQRCRGWSVPLSTSRHSNPSSSAVGGDTGVVMSTASTFTSDPFSEILSFSASVPTIFCAGSERGISETTACETRYRYSAQRSAQCARVSYFTTYARKLSPPR